jgi:hypothetical protein
MLTQDGVAAQDNARVLDNSSIEVEGLKFVGVGDPRFTPDKSTRGKPPPRSVHDTGKQLAALALREVADIALIHDPDGAREVDGSVPLVLAGHFHRREQHELPNGTLLFQQGSTGASGLRGLEREGPTPYRCSVLYFARDTKTLQAWDDITLGGLGLTSAKIERRVYNKPPEPDEDSPAPNTPDATTPTSPGPAAPSPTG